MLLMLLSVLHLLRFYSLVTDRVFSLFRFAFVVCFAYLAIACESRSEFVK